MHQHHFDCCHGRYEELRNIVHAMKNSQKIKDLAKVQSSRFCTLQFVV